MTRPTHRLLAVAATGVLALVALCACSAGEGAGGGASGYKPGSVSRSYSGTTISVMLPPWATFPATELAAFTKATGITVQMQTLAFDAIHDKVVTAEAAAQAPADVVEMDWTWVAQFGAAGWFADLKPYLSPAQLADSVGADTFVTGGKRVGVPYNLDFRGTEVNMTMLKKAGVDTAPTTTAELLTAAAAVKRAGVVQYPIGVPLKVLEGTSTPWYALVRAAGGRILTAKGQPAFTGSAGTESLQFFRDAYARGLVDPGAIGLTDVQVSDAFTAGRSAILLATGPGGNAQFTDAEKSRIAKDDLLFTHMPGRSDADGPTVGLEEGLSIPVNAAHKEAAATFIAWYLRTPQALAGFEDPDMGNLPPSRAALQQLASDGKLPQSKTVLGLVGDIQPVIEGGAPTWYSKFSAAAAATIQAVALGKETAEAGASDLAEQTKQFAAQGG